LDLSGEGGLLFDRYVRLSSLGQGAFGTVYRAKDTKTGEIVALKVLSEEQGRHEEHRYRFLRETYALSAVKHANVVRVVDFGLSEGRLYYAMDCVEGVDLFMFVGGRNGVSEAGLVSLLKPVASALAAMHERNLVHRDLKPRNIMLRAGRLDDPVLIDFGLTKQSTDRGVTDPRVIMGTPGYIPPEVYGGTEFGPVGDLFSLGMVARFTLFGELWPELGAFDLMTRMIKQKVSVPPMGNEQLRELILRLLERDPKERFQSAAEVSTALADLQLDDADSQELPPTPQRDSGYDTTQTMRRRRPGVDAPTSEESE
jgi:serine/threonine-protein kinase